MRPGERLIVCRNPDLARERRRKPEALLAATARSGGARRRGGAPAPALSGAAAIGLELGAALDRHKMAKHFALIITDDRFHFARRTRAIAAEAALDGPDVVRTSLLAETPTPGRCAPTSRAPSSNGVPAP
jgi:hypothetical protein